MRVLGCIKSPYDNGDTHSLGFPFKNTVFSYVKTLGRVFWAIKNHAGMGIRTPYKFSSQKIVFSYGNTLGRFLGA